MSTQNSTFREVLKLFVIQRNEMPNLKVVFKVEAYSLVGNLVITISI